MHRRLRREDPAYLQAMKEAKAMFEAEMAKSAMKGRGRPKTVVVTPAAPVPLADDDVIDLVDEVPEGATGEFKIEVGEPEEVEEGEDHAEVEVVPAAREPARTTGKAAPAKGSAARSASAGASKRAAAPARAGTPKGAKSAKSAKSAKPARTAKPARNAKSVRTAKPAKAGKGAKATRPAPKKR